MWGHLVVLLSLLVLGHAAQSAILPDGTAVPYPQFPDQFSATIRLTVLNCDDPTAYPPCERVAKVHYDLAAQQAAVHWAKGFEEDVWQTYIKRYDLGREYELKEVCIDDRSGGKFCEEQCSRADMHGSPELAPPPVLDEHNVELAGVDVESAGNTLKNVHWKLNVEGAQLVYTVNVTGHPVSLLGEYMRWDVENFHGGPPHASKFVVPNSWKPMEKCQRQEGNVGYPYQHVFFHFIRI